MEPPDHLGGRRVPASPARELLELHRATSFVFDARGRATHEAAPDRSRGPRFSLCGCRDGNVAVVRDDVRDEVADGLLRLARGERPLAEPDSVPLHAERYAALLGDAPDTPGHGLLWSFPGPLAPSTEVGLVRSGTRDGDDLLSRFADVVAPGLVEMGFRSAADLWAPWCVALVDDRVVSVAETVRAVDGVAGAEVGVDTDPAHRGHGLGAAVVAAWSSHPELSGRTLFYGTRRDNPSSRRVTDRLGLDFLGATFAVQ